MEHPRLESARGIAGKLLLEAPTASSNWFTQKTRKERNTTDVNPIMFSFMKLALVCLLFVHPLHAVESVRRVVPLGGNCYLTKSSDGSSDRVDANGISCWRDPTSGFSVFFRADRAAILNLSLRMKVPEGMSVIRVASSGTRFEKSVTGDAFQDVSLGSITVTSPGYVRLDLSGIRKQGAVFAELTDLLVESQTAGLVLNYVADAAENRFYWGRRGPSVHLQYEMPANTKSEYFYNEVTVPKDQDPIGTYVMANGFGEGYFGMQVNGPDERRILFSVWSPFSTDDPKNIPEDHRIQLLAKGKGVHSGEFGNEGSGGQSFMIYPWKAGTTYRFLNRVRPDGQGHTDYTAWFFAPEAGKWQLIASFRRPKTDKHLTGAHSFLENFQDRNGYHGRMAFYGNQWARDTDGKWHEITKAILTGDDIAQREYRMDYAGGAEHAAFFLRNGGFFADPVKLGTRFERGPGRRKPPEIDFTALEAVK